MSPETRHRYLIACRARFRLIRHAHPVTTREEEERIFSPGQAVSTPILQFARHPIAALAGSCHGRLDLLP